MTTERDLQFSAACIAAEANLARLDGDIAAHRELNAQRRRAAIERQAEQAQRQIDRAFPRRRT